MSKAKKRSTPLKSKSPRRAATLAKPKVTAFSRRVCEVAEAARRYKLLYDARAWICEGWEEADQQKRDAIRAKTNAIDGALRGCIENGAQKQAYSALGACFQVLMLWGELAAIRDAKGGENTFRHFDRMRRMLCSLSQLLRRDAGHPEFPHGCGNRHARLQI